MDSWVDGVLIVIGAAVFIICGYVAFEYCEVCHAIE